MGTTQAKAITDDDWIDTENHKWVRNSVRVRSKAHALTEWDDLGDKNADYYKGLRNTVINPSLYAIPVCNTHSHGTWWRAAWNYDNDRGEAVDNNER